MLYKKDLATMCNNIVGKTVPALKIHMCFRGRVTHMSIEEGRLFLH